MLFDLLPQWLKEEFCSLAASRLEPIEPPIQNHKIVALVDEGYEDLKASDRQEMAGEILAFTTKMSIGDIVVTTKGRQVFVGEVSGTWSFTRSESGRSNLRCGVTWRNADSAIDYDDLKAPLPAKLQQGGDLVELTSELKALESLGVGEEVDTAEKGHGPAATLPPHEELPAPSEDLSKELFVDQSWLEEVRDLLNERKQLIFYGPPGTGKTFIARKLAADLVGPENVRLVQFHPAYTYEDFFEGFRPKAADGASTISFELKAGPLRQLVKQAEAHPDQAYLLIIDEINRANLAKVFGELYFLLEYRDQVVSLLYSGDVGFTLPENIYIIGTMNTADRSIALIDTAMRRRFAFLELSPDLEPTKSLLRRWSKHNGLGELAANLLERLNNRIDDPDFRIGPSYFMPREPKDAHSKMRLERIWKTAILPLLQEHHYGEWENFKSRYRLETLLAESTTASVSESTTDQTDGPSAS